MILIFVSGLTFAQGQTEKKQTEKSIVVNSPEYREAKLNGTLDQYMVLQPQPRGVYDYSNPGTPVTKKKGEIPGKASGCNCYIEPDSTYTLALAPNDDGSSGLINLPFSFCFYGDIVNSCYINNNGNITFDNPMSTYSASAFPSFGSQIVAPFWGDVDTGPDFNGAAIGEVLYKITPTALIVNWKDVGYFSDQGDKRNTFQLIITDGTDPLIDGGNVAFCYQDMQWTTGAASNGVNGFGGVPATCGANKGDNLAYFLVARFDHAGSDFDGALGNPDGISWLDNKSFFFDVCNTSNIPPIPNGASSCDTFKVCSIGDTAYIPFIFLSPETNQITTISVNSGTLTNLQVVSNIPGNTASAILRVIGDINFVDTHTVIITATDNFVPPGITTLNLTVIIDSSGTANFNPIISPTIGCDSVIAGVLNGPYGSYLWDNLLLDSTIVINSPINDFGVTVEQNGCYKRVTANFLVGPAVFNLNSTDMFVCPQGTELVYVTDSINLASASWGLPNPAQDTLFSANLGVGTYTLTVTNSIGCTNDTTFTISSQPAILLNQLNTLCGDSAELINNFGVEGGTWSTLSGPGTVTFYPATQLQTSAEFSLPGTYVIVYSEPVCNDADTLLIDVTYYPYVVVADIIGCVGEPEEAPAFDTWENITSYNWSNGQTGPVATLTEGGNYYVTATNICGSHTWAFYFDARPCDIEMPNVFSPNGDLVNGIYAPIIGQNESFPVFKCQIFNRWGNLMYEFVDMNKGWNGVSQSGAAAEDGVYYYKIEAKDLTGKELNKQGFFHLVRD